MVYNARLLNSAGNAITTAHKVRFSFWKSADAVSGDITGTGAINTGAANYASWQEVDTVTPDSKGYFSVELGSGSSLPSFETMATNTLTSLHLQVEVKASSAADTAYEILDPKPLDSLKERSPFDSVPLALNAALLDQHDVGTGSGSIPLLQSGGLLPVSTVPGGTNRDTFTIDANNSASTDITLKFGDTLSKTLLYSITNSRFEFNAPVRISGSLTVTGLINGVDITSLNTAAPLRAASGGGLTVSVYSGSYRVNGNITNFSGTSATLTNNADTYLFFTGTGLVARTSGFPTNVSFIPVAKVTTANGGVASVSDRRVLQSDNRENSILDVLHPEFKDTAYQGDGADNVGQMSVTNDGTSKNNYYLWSSTRSSLQDYDVYIRATLPQHFKGWKSNPITLNYRTSSASASDNRLDVTLFDTAGNAVTLNGGSSLVSASWTTAAMTFSGTPTWTAGQNFLLKIKVSAKSAAEAHIGDLELRYVEMEQE